MDLIPRTSSHAAALLVALLPLAGSASAQTPPKTLDALRRVASLHGPFRIWTYDHSAIAERTGTPTQAGWLHGREHPFSTWTIGGHSITGHVETWSDCSVPGRAGVFDVRRSRARVSPYLELVVYEVRPRFAAGSGVGVHRFRWVERLDPNLEGIGGGEVRVMLPATGCLWIRDAIANLTRAVAATNPDPFGFRPYWPDATDTLTGFYNNRLNIADVVSAHAFDATGAPVWGFAVHLLDEENAGTGNLLVGSNPDSASVLSLEIGHDHVLANDHRENNAVPGRWIQVSAVVLRSLPSVTPAEYAWWENVGFVRTQLMDPLDWVHSPSPLSTSPAWARTAVVGTGYMAADDEEARLEVPRIESFFAKYDQAEPRIPEYHYVPAFSTWTDGLYVEPMRPAFRSMMGEVNRFRTLDRARTHVLAYLATGFFESPQPLSTPLAAALAHNDQGQPYAVFDRWRVDPSHPAFVAAYDNALQTLRSTGVEGLYFDALFGEGLRDYRHHRGAEPANHLDQIALVDRVRTVHQWDAMFLGEQSRLGNRYAAGAFLPCGIRTIPGGSGVPFIDALVHDRRLTVGAGDLLEQWFAHVKFVTDVLPPPAATKRDVQNVLHDYVFGFVKGQLVLDGRTEYEVDPGGEEPTVEIQIFQADPALHPNWADPAEVLGFEVLKDVADLLYPRMMRWRSTTLALQEGRMLPPPYPTPRVAGSVVSEWFVIEKLFFFKVPGYTVPNGLTSTYETERYPVSFWALPSDPDQLTLFMGNPTYDPVTLHFAFSTADYPTEMGSDRWDVVLDRDPEAHSAVRPLLVHDAATTFDFTVRLAPLTFRRVTFHRH